MEDLEAAAQNIPTGSVPDSALLVTEFIDTADSNGAFHKYGVYNVGGEIVPRHIIVSKDWVNKGQNRIITDETMREETPFMEENPHAEEVRELFTLSGIDYGRIDYGLMDGRLQVFEINTNPATAHPGVGKYPQRANVKQHFLKHFVPAIKGLDVEARTGDRIPVCFDSRPRIVRRGIRCLQLARTLVRLIYIRIDERFRPHRYAKIIPAFWSQR